MSQALNGFRFVSEDSYSVHYVVVADENGVLDEVERLLAIGRKVWCYRLGERPNIWPVVGCDPADHEPVTVLVLGEIVHSFDPRRA